jgi:hypothetical protein
VSGRKLTNFGRETSWTTEQIAENITMNCRAMSARMEMDGTDQDQARRLDGGFWY